MKVQVDKAKFADKLNEVVDIPYLTEETEKQIFRNGVSAAAAAVSNALGDSAAMLEWGVTVTDDDGTPV